MRRRLTTETKWINIRQRLLELALYVAIALTVVVGIFLYAIYGPKKPPPFMRWIPFALNTALVFGYSSRSLQHLWKKPKLWALLFGFLVLHGIVGWVVLSRLQRVPLIWYIPVSIAEISILVQSIVRIFATEGPALRASFTRLPKR